MWKQKVQKRLSPNKDTLLTDAGRTESWNIIFYLCFSFPDFRTYFLSSWQNTIPDLAVQRGKTSSIIHLLPRPSDASTAAIRTKRKRPTQNHEHCAGAAKSKNHQTQMICLIDRYGTLLDHHNKSKKWRVVVDKYFVRKEAIGHLK